MIMGTGSEGNLVLILGLLKIIKWSNIAQMVEKEECRRVVDINCDIQLGLVL
jgi:hypothetical protein